MKLIHITLLVCFFLGSALTTQAQELVPHFSDSCHWEISIGLGHRFFATENADPKFTKPNGRTFQVAGMYRFTENLFFYGQYAISRDTNFTISRAWEAGFHLEVSGHRLRPFVKLGFGELRVAGTDSASFNRQNSTFGWSRIPFQFGLGANWLFSEKGHGLRLEATSYAWRHPSTKTNPDFYNPSGLMFHLGIGFFKRF